VTVILSLFYIITRQLVLDIRAHMHTGSDVAYGPHVRLHIVCGSCACESANVNLNVNLESQ
jgi:hypothetical protein